LPHYYKDENVVATGFVTEEGKRLNSEGKKRYPLDNVVDMAFDWDFKRISSKGTCNNYCLTITKMKMILQVDSTLKSEKG